MHRMRARLLAVSLLAAPGLAGCSGFSIGVRQDKEDAASVARVLERPRLGDRLRASELLECSWTRLFVLPGGITTQAVEDRIGVPFPQSGEELPAGPGYLVFVDDDAVVSAFSAVGGVEVPPVCLAAEREPLGPRAELILVPGAARGSARLSTAALAPGCR